MEYLLNHEEMAACDRATSDNMGIPSIVLMERAALSIRDVVRERYPLAHRILAVCGSGNNGGDGFAAARLLHLDGLKADVLFVGNHAHMTEQTAAEAKIFSNYGGITLPDDSPVTGYDLIIDALFGNGLHREIIGRYADIVNAVNRSRTKVLSVDIPSGISADDGQIKGTAIRADCTVTFAFRKLGQLLYPGCEYCGKLYLKDVGINGYGIHDEPVYTISDKDLRDLLPRRHPDANKGTYGKLLLIAGKENMAGAALMSGRAACRSGCGLVCVFSHDKNRSVIQNSLPEAIFAPWWNDIQTWLEWADAVAIGPGLGTSYQSRQILTYVLRNCSGPIVIDADALNLMASNPEIRPEGSIPAVITPHPGEMARLLNGAGSPDNYTAGDVASSPIEIARQYADAAKCVTVLKGARTVVTDGQDTMLSLTGNEGMATGGSGDVLTGIIGSLLAQGMSPLDAARSGVVIHGMAGDAAAQKLGSRSLLATDIISFLPQVFLQLS